MNLANRLTMLRIVLALAMFMALMRQERSSHVIAAILFIAALATDWIDGYIARMTQTISAFGKIADPIADKILVIGAFIALIKNKDLDIPLWGVFLIIAREFFLGGIRTLAGMQGKTVAAERWGKWKMGIQSLALLVILLILVASEYSQPLPSWALNLPYALTVLCVIAAWVSAWLYFRQNKTMIEGSWK